MFIKKVIKYFSISLASMLVIAIAIVIIFPPQPVYLSGETIIFRGGIDYENVSKAISFLRDTEHKVTRMQIRSVGGDVFLGMELGAEINRTGIELEVEEFCISSCANYLFIAAKSKILRGMQYE